MTRREQVFMGSSSLIHARRSLDGQSRVMSYDNPIRGRLNAWFFRRFDNYIDTLLGERKRALLAEHPPDVVEIGPGVGANFRYLAPGTRVIAVEPNPQMHAPLRATAAKHGVSLDLVPRGAEDTGLPDSSVDFVLSTLVLCTVPNLEGTLAEVRRILRPGGRFVFVEHVAAKPGSWLRRLQGLVRRPWQWLFEGCHTHRETLGQIHRAGFAEVVAESEILRSPFVPVNSQVYGVAIA